MKILALAAGTALALSMAASASAAPYQFTISGFDTNDANEVEFASFQIDSNPTPTPGTVENGIGFSVGSVPGVYQYDTTVLTDPQDISFYTGARNGGLFVGNGDLLAFDGPVLYTGPESSPTFKTGTFTLTDYYDNSPISLKISALTSAVPEPASWAMMIGGFGLLGGVLRARKTSVAFATA